MAYWTFYAHGETTIDTNQSTRGVEEIDVPDEEQDNFGNVGDVRKFKIDRALYPHITDTLIENYNKQGTTFAKASVNMYLSTGLPSIKIAYNEGIIDSVDVVGGLMSLAGKGANSGRKLGTLVREARKLGGKDFNHEDPRHIGSHGNHRYQSAHVHLAKIGGEWTTSDRLKIRKKAESKGLVPEQQNAPQVNQGNDNNNNNEQDKGIEKHAHV